MITATRAIATLLAEYKVAKGTGQNYYTGTGPTFEVEGGFSKTPPIFEHYQQHFIDF